jgi:hypothetical protein
MAAAPNWVTYNEGLLDKFSYRIFLQKFNKGDLSGSNFVGIESIVSTLSIKQELIRNSMILEMKVSDSGGILENAIIQVGSIINIEICRDPNSKNEEDAKVAKKLFVVTRIDDNIQSAQLKQRVFNITAHSFAGVSNVWPLLYSEYSGPTKPTDIIKQIVTKRFIQNGAGEIVDNLSKKWINCTNEIKNGILLHQVKPFDAISHLVSKSVSPDNSEYFFYEDFNGFNLRTLKSMKNESNGKEKTFIYYQDKTQRLGNKDKEQVSDYFRILYLTQHKQQDYFELVQDGAVINQVSVFDIINKEVITKDFRYNTSANSAFVLGNKTAFPSNTVSFISFTNNPPYNEGKYPYDIAPHSKIAISEKAWNRDDYLLDNYNIPVAQRTLMEQNKITVEIYGNQNIVPGDIINMKVPSKSAIDSDLESLIRRQSGKFLVGAVKHNIFGTKFQTFLDLYVDSYDEEVTERSPEKSNETT